MCGYATEAYDVIPTAETLPPKLADESVPNVATTLLFVTNEREWLLVVPTNPTLVPEVILTSEPPVVAARTKVAPAAATELTLLLKVAAPVESMVSLSEFAVLKNKVLSAFKIVFTESAYIV